MSIQCATQKAKGGSAQQPLKATKYSISKCTQSIIITKVLVGIFNHNCKFYFKGLYQVIDRDKSQKCIFIPVAQSVQAPYKQFIFPEMHRLFCRTVDPGGR